MNQSMTYEEFQKRVGSVILTENGNCPVTPVVQMLQGKWKLQIIYELCIQSPMRFGELKKVHWPTRQEVTTYTGVVLVTVAIITVLIWIVDSGITALFSLIV